MDWDVAVAASCDKKIALACHIVPGFIETSCASLNIFKLEGLFVIVALLAGVERDGQARAFI